MSAHPELLVGRRGRAVPLARQEGGDGETGQRQKFGIERNLHADDGTLDKTRISELHRRSHGGQILTGTGRGVFAKLLRN